MATTPTTEQLTLTSQERTWRCQIETPFGSDYVLQAFRETVRTADGALFGQPDKNAGVVTRTLSNAAADTVTLASGKTVNVPELAEALVRHIEAWRAADLAPPVVEEPEGGE